MFARQLENGRYVCVHKPLSQELLVRHLSGNVTLGAYLLDTQSRARFAVLDADDEQGMDRLLRTARLLSVEKTPSYLEQSRRGGHLWLFFDEPLPAKLVKKFGEGVLAVHGDDQSELYPKQDHLEEGPGSLIRLPFGIHRLTKKRYGFLNLEGEPLAKTMQEQLQKLVHPRTIPIETIKTYAAFEKKKTPRPHTEMPEGRGESLSAQIKARVSVLDFVGKYVELKPTDGGATGLCPFHNDGQPSLGINRDKNYWHCFAGCGGGSVIDFWMKYHNCDFTAAVKELANMLL